MLLDAAACGAALTVPHLLPHATCAHARPVAGHVTMLFFFVAAGAPRSKNITFGVSDVLELVTLLDSGTAAPWAVGAASGQPGAVVRPSRWVGG